MMIKEKNDTNLPPLTALRTFEVAAKHLSFTHAADELGVTLGAISRQIKLLEKSLNTNLFERTRRGVKLTAEGLMLYETISYNFDQIRSVTRRLRHQQTHTLTVASTTAFASQWLMPRLGGFWQKYPNITLNHSLANNLGSLNRHQANLYFRYGNGKWPGQVATKLYEDRLYPVCSPEYYEKNKDKPLDEHILIQMFDDDAHWSAWDEWLQAKNRDANTLKWRHFNNYIIAIDAAEHGQGIAMGWHSLISKSLAQGKLVPFRDFTIATPGAFYLTWAEDVALNSDAECFRQWLSEVVKV